MVCLLLVLCSNVCPRCDASTIKLIRCSGSLKRRVRILPERKWWQVLRVVAVSTLVCSYRWYFWVLKGCFWEEVRDRSPANWRATQHKTPTLSTCQAPTPRDYELQLAWRLWTDIAHGKQRDVQLVLHRWALVKWWGAPWRPPRAVHMLCSNIRSHYMEIRYFWGGLSITKIRPD